MADESAPQVLIDDAVRRQVLLEGVKESDWQDFQEYLVQIERVVRNRLTEEGDKITTRARLNKLVSDLRRSQREIYAIYVEQLIGNLDDVALTEAELEGQSLNSTVFAFEAVMPSAEQVIMAYQRNLLSIEGQSMALQPFLKEFTEKQIQAITSAVNQGYIEGKTISQIVRDVRGTRVQNFNDGVIGKINRNDRAMVRTAIQNAAMQARERVWISNRDLVIGVEWVSTLDSRTTPQCRSLDGEIFPINEGPRPPIHYGCRSTTAPVLSSRFDWLQKGAKRPAVGADGTKQVRATTTYYSWLKSQPASFQDEVIGPTRGKLLRNGGLNAEEFSTLQLNRSFQPRTLEEMRRIAPQAFAEANL